MTGCGTLSQNRARCRRKLSKWNRWRASSEFIVGCCYEYDDGLNWWSQELYANGMSTYIYTHTSHTERETEDRRIIMMISGTSHRASHTIRYKRFFPQHESALGISLECKIWIWTYVYIYYCVIYICIIVIMAHGNCGVATWNETIYEKPENGREQQHEKNNNK